MKRTVIALAGLFILGCGREPEIGGQKLSTICDQFVRDLVATGPSNPDIFAWREAGIRMTAARLNLTADQVQVALADYCDRPR